MAVFRISFDGPSVESGEIDVSELAPALLALGDLVKSANQAVNKGQAEAKLKLKAAEKGSFEALLSLDVSFATGILDMMADHEGRVTAARDLLEILIGIGVVGGGTCAFFKALRHLGGKRAEASERLDNGQVTITSGGTTITVDQRTATLIEDGPTRQAAKKFVETSLKSDGVSSVSFRTQDAVGASEPELKITRTDHQAVSIPEPSDDDKHTVTQTRQAHLKIVSAQFHEGYLWRFFDGQNIFTASMEDPQFLNQLHRAEVALSKEDTLLCKIEETQELVGNVLKSSARIVTVIEHIPGARQLRLL